MQDRAQHPEGSPGILVQHRIYEFSDDWTIGEEPVPEAPWHDDALDLLKALLLHWVARSRRNVAVYRNIAVRVRREKPRVGFDLDLALVDPAPAGERDISSLRVWDPGHAVPKLVIEVVSPSHPYKDYSDIPDRCAAVGVSELVVFDPMLAGPKAFGGPFRLQGWRRTDAGTFERVVAGEGPVPSAILGAHFVAVEDGRRLRIADDEAGTLLWQTAEEDARLAEQRALARVAELEAELTRRSR
jgi:Uma2 family endonuclease